MIAAPFVELGFFSKDKGTDKQSANVYEHSTQETHLPTSHLTLLPGNQLPKHALLQLDINPSGGIWPMFELLSNTFTRSKPRDAEIEEGEQVSLSSRLCLVYWLITKTGPCPPHGQPQYDRSASSQRILPRH